MATDTTGGQPGTDESQAAAGSQQEKTFTQAEVDDIVGKRLARAKAQVPDDYEDLKAAKAELDQLREANKSDLEKANDKLAKAEAELKELKAAQAHREAVAKAASEHKVDAELLMLMQGDADENAKLLAEKLKPNGYATSRDNGEPASKGADYKHETVAALFGRK